MESARVLASSDSTQARLDFPFAGDVYSFGIVLGEIHFKKSPRQDFGSDEIKEAVINGKRPYLLNNVPSDLSTIIEKCCKQDPKDRMLMSDVVLAIEKSGKIPSTHPITDSSGIRIREKERSDPVKFNPISRKPEKIKLSEQEDELGTDYYKKGIELYNSDEFDKAKEWFEKKGALGNANAMNILGFMYQNGRGVIQDYIKAKDLYENSGALGNASAMNNLGSMYNYGQGVRQDHTKARELHEKSAALEKSSATYGIGALINREQGVVANK